MYLTAQNLKQDWASMQVFITRIRLINGSLRGLFCSKHVKAANYMESSSQIHLVGGTGHGQSIQVEANIDEIELDVHITDPPAGTPLFTETYERRHFEGDGFGAGVDCFALKSDDATEQKELARWSNAPHNTHSGS